MKQGLVRLLYNLGKVYGVDITHDNVCSSMLSCFYWHLLSTGRPISSLNLKYLNISCNFYPTALKGCRGIVFTHGVRMGGAGRRLGEKFVWPVSQKL